jgi:hypothetical protein
MRWHQVSILLNLSSTGASSAPIAHPHAGHDRRSPDGVERRRFAVGRVDERSTYAE